MEDTELRDRLIRKLEKLRRKIDAIAETNIRREIDEHLCMVHNLLVSGNRYTR